MTTPHSLTSPDFTVFPDLLTSQKRARERQEFIAEAQNSFVNQLSLAVWGGVCVCLWGGVCVCMCVCVCVYI